MIVLNSHFSILIFINFLFYSIFIYHILLIFHLVDVLLCINLPFTTKRFHIFMNTLSVSNEVLKSPVSSFLPRFLPNRSITRNLSVLR
jgi:hypothetical protein